jgi:hypothetical protein
MAKLTQRPGAFALETARPVFAFETTSSVIRNDACDISADTKQTLRAELIRHAETMESVWHFHAPKLCLGETHVLTGFYPHTRNNASGRGEYPLCTQLVVAMAKRK